MSNLRSQLTTIDLDSLTAVTGGGGGAKTAGGAGGSAPRKAPGKGKGLSPGKRAIITGVGLIGLLGGPDDVMPKPIEIPNFKPPITTSQPKFVI